MNPRIGNTLRRYRMRRGLLNYQAAYAFDVSPATWSRYETDHQAIPDDLLARVTVTWRAWGLLRGHPAVRATVEALLAEGLLRQGARLPWDATREEMAAALEPAGWREDDGPRDPAPAQVPA